VINFSGHRQSKTHWTVITWPRFRASFHTHIYWRVYKNLVRAIQDRIKDHRAREAKVLLPKELPKAIFQSFSHICLQECFPIASIIRSRWQSLGNLILLFTYMLFIFFSWRHLLLYPCTSPLFGSNSSGHWSISIIPCNSGIKSKQFCLPAIVLVECCCDQVTAHIALLQETARR
jgi:hypothetical protein